MDLIGASVLRHGVIFEPTIPLGTLIHLAGIWIGIWVFYRFMARRMNKACKYPNGEIRPKDNGKPLMGILLLAIGLSGCAVSDRIAVDRAHFLLTYADAKATYAVLSFQFHQGCTAKTISSQICDQLAPIEDKVKQIDPEIRFVILHPEVEPDWGKIAVVLGLILELATKGGGVP